MDACTFALFRGILPLSPVSRCHHERENAIADQTLDTSHVFLCLELSYPYCNHDF